MEERPFAGLVLLAATVALAVANPPTDEPGDAPPSPALGSAGGMPDCLPVESLSHHYHHHHHRHGKSDSPSSSESPTGLQWCVVGAVGKASLHTLLNLLVTFLKAEEKRSLLVVCACASSFQNPVLGALGGFEKGVDYCH